MVDMNNFFFDPERSLGFMTFTAHRLMTSFLRRRMAQAGIDLTGEQWGVMVFVWNRGAIGQDELTHALCMDKTGMSRLLATMEDKGLVTRSPDPDDARRRVVTATQAGDALKERSRAVAEEALVLLLQDISPQDHATCMRVLATVKDTLRDLAPEPGR
jgi:DNA-binding MarR family transcriptional regulator